MYLSNYVEFLQVSFLHILQLTDVGEALCLFYRYSSPPFSLSSASAAF